MPKQTVWFARLDYNFVKSTSRFRLTFLSRSTIHFLYQLDWSYVILYHYVSLNATLLQVYTHIHTEYNFNSNSQLQPFLNTHLSQFLLFILSLYSFFLGWIFEWSKFSNKNSFSSWKYMKIECKSTAQIQELTHLSVVFSRPNFCLSFFVDFHT